MKIRHAAAASALTVLFLASQQAAAHPGFVTGTANLSLINRGPASTTNPDTGAVTNSTADTSAAGPTRGYLEDGIRISHGCSNESGQYVPGKSAVNAVSWVFPTGENPNDPAPMSTGCDNTGANCTGTGTQPSVATIPNSAQKPNYKGAPWAAGTATAANLADHLCSAASATDFSCGSRISSLAGRFNPQGNPAYFKTFKPTKSGFWAKGRKLKDGQLQAYSANFGVPYANAIEAQYVSNRAAPTVPNVFSPESCARKLVVRLAGADICKIESRRVLRNAHSQNFWFGGPTDKFVDGHGVHENFWMGYNLLVRDVTKNPYPASCKDKKYGDYDLVVMPSITEINKGLPFPGWARSE